MKRRNPESGFAMLMVFVLAAAIAITLYMEIPRVVFESERAKEQILVDRGNQYKRAIQLYVRKIRKYPAKIDDLESTNNIRFLRHRYKDPLTGKEEWRLIHIANGQLTDSLLQKFDPLKNDKDKSLNAGNSPGGSTGDPNATGTDPQTGQPLWSRGRPSDKVLTAANGGPPPNPEDPNAPPPQPPYPGQPQQPQYPAGQPQYPGQPGYPQQPQYPGQPAGPPGFPQYPQVPVGQPGFAPQPFPNQPYNPLPPNQPPNPGQPFNPGQPGQPNSAASIISQILTTPRQPPAGLGYPVPGGYPPQPGQPGYQPRYDANGNLLPSGPPGFPPQPGQPNQPTSPPFNTPGPPANPGNIPSNSVIGGGIAGVASTA